MRGWSILVYSILLYPILTLHPTFKQDRATDSRMAKLSLKVGAAQGEMAPSPERRRQLSEP